MINTRKMFLIIDYKNLSFLREAQMVAALSPKQIELSEHLPILSILPIVSELQNKRNYNHFIWLK